MCTSLFVLSKLEQYKMRTLIVLNTDQKNRGKRSIILLLPPNYYTLSKVSKLQKLLR